ncbi:MAG TPA: NAD(P)/FAD-dependent oxidoreductase [Chitinophagales bacterium]|nr:NAD(P)/FAD-dependent oxidoreductase [Chitinophagales bacterium]HNI53154.1 NAD(P)/FAD-dependent oxidoreductase [Chitinophagales bacterium]HNJ88042.1 NAD(P)/FAD-dependent oxidoreductase [Chitinophagales bacterium]HNK96664.1 NAD(P)/FAD-dependent oxidoreductase [Chitinophagales bacterium]
MQVKNIAIMGAGLVGSLLSMYLKKHGYQVTVYERRPDYRKAENYGGRSINLAISERGWKGLAGVGLEELVREIAIPMPGRMIHDVQGNLNFQPYGKPGEAINSVSRGGLNVMMIDAAEKAGVTYLFEQRIMEIDPSGKKAMMEDMSTGRHYTLEPDLIIGADGAYSLVRYAMLKTDRFDYSQAYEAHGYKELTIPAGPNGSFLIDRDALHIWPRKQFMLIALPNIDGSFTCTLFFSLEGKESFEAIKTLADLDAFFDTYFPDVKSLIPDLHHDFFANPTGLLMIVKCFPWSHGNTMLIGDAAHAIIPFYGQGMNCGFEDCTVLDTLIEEFNHDWSKIMPAYERLRKPNSDAIADLAKLNFIEMRDLVADADFQFKKRIAAKVSALHPDRFIPVYSMVSFSHLPYKDALSEYHRQDAVLTEILGWPEIENRWETDYLPQIAERLFNK